MSQASVLTGRLETVLLDLADRAATGCLHVRDEHGDEAEIYLRDGLVYAVSVPGRRMMLGARLLSSGALTPEALAEALEIQRTELQGWRLGELLVHLGYTDRSVVESYVVEQLKDGVTALLGWPESRWRFRTGRKTRQDVAPPIGVEALLREVADRLTTWADLAEVVGGPTATPRLSTRSAAGPEVVLGPNDWALLCKVDGERSITDLATDCGFTLFEAGSVVAHLVGNSLVDVDPRSPDIPTQTGPQDLDVRDALTRVTAALDRASRSDVEAEELARLEEAQRELAERQAAEQAETERLATAEREAAEHEAAERAKAECEVAERQAAEQAEAERLATFERQAAEQAEAEREVAERQAAKQAEAERLATFERQAAEQAEAEREVAERQAADQAETLRQAAALAEAERAEEERVAAEQAGRAVRAASSAHDAPAEHDSPSEHGPTRHAAALGPDADELLAALSAPRVVAAKRETSRDSAPTTGWETDTLMGQSQRWADEHDEGSSGHPAQELAAAPTAAIHLPDDRGWESAELSPAAMLRELMMSGPTETVTVPMPSAAVADPKPEPASSAGRAPTFSAEADTASLLRELSSLGMDDSAPAQASTHRSSTPGYASANRPKRRGLFGRS